MTAIPTRGKTAALVLKTADGPLVAPNNAGQFVALQADFALAPNFETTENLEIRDDIMAGQQVISGENPTGTFSHYLTGSGTEGGAPEYSPALRSTFGEIREFGTSTTEVVVAGNTSTVSQLNVATGSSGVGRYKKGDAVLIKDATNGYAIRPIKSVDATNGKLNLAFDLENAPAAGVGLGKFVTYAPVASGQPGFDVWEYFSNNSGNQNVINCRVTSMSVTADASANINATYSFEGTAYRLNQDFKESYVINTAKQGFVVAYGSGLSSEVLVDLDAGNYTGTTLAVELQAKLRAATGPGLTDLLVSYNAVSRRFTFTKPGTTGQTFSLDFGTTGGTPNADPGMAAFLGFDDDVETAAVPAAGGSLTSTKNSVPTSIDFTSGLTPAYDNQPPVIARDQRLFLGDNTDNVCLDASSVSLTINTPTTTIGSICQESGIFAKILSSRDATLSVSAILQSDDQRFFSKFKNGDTVPFAFLGGQKRNGRWVPGNCFSVYGSQASISSFALTDSDGVYGLDMDLLCYSPGDGTGSIFLSFL